VDGFSSDDDIYDATWISSWKDYGESSSESEASGDDFENEDQCVGAMAVPSPVQTATSEPGPSTTCLPQNQHACQQNEQSMLVPEQKRNIWRERPFRPKQLIIPEEDVRTDQTTAKGLVVLAY
jgi:hypothetical protein